VLLTVGVLILCQYPQILHFFLLAVSLQYHFHVLCPIAPIICFHFNVSNHFMVSGSLVPLVIIGTSDHLQEISGHVFPFFFFCGTGI
jgi:hypothetical protein